MENIRFGLCCVFREHPIRFKIKQAKYLKKFDRKLQLELLSETILENGEALLAAVKVCHNLGIGCFRINSRFFPLKTHPEVGYKLTELPGHDSIMELLTNVRSFSFTKDIRLTFHPDQFILLTSPKDDVVKNSIADLIYHNELAEIVGADAITIHGGGSYGDKNSTLMKLKDSIRALPTSLLQRLVLENDDRVFSPVDLLPLCAEIGIPLVYDVHHHRCLSDSLTEQEATREAFETWDREPLFHLSSPRDGWESVNPIPHADMINPDDFPRYWLDLPITVEIEAKAKELAIRRLQNALSKN